MRKHEMYNAHVTDGDIDGASSQVLAGYFAVNSITHHIFICVQIQSGHGIRNVVNQSPRDIRGPVAVDIPRTAEGDNVDNVNNVDNEC
jgi:hypothetical protein